ncbi:MAG: hypothetical protein ACYDEJ_06755 [Desulfitobacteriaceae bacterium]
MINRHWLTNQGELIKGIFSYRIVSDNMELDYVFPLAGGKMIAESEDEDEREESAYAKHIGTVHE